MLTVNSAMTNKTLFSVLTIAILSLAASPANADSWSFQLEPYVLAPMIDGDAGIGRIQGVDVDVSTSDILDTLNLGGMVHFEANHENGWGVALDYAFMDLSDDLTGPRGGVVDVDAFEGVLEAFLIKGTGAGNEGLDYIVGLRWWSIELDVEIDPAILPGTVSSSIEEDWVDVFIGARWKNPINEKWLFSFRADVGAGSADFTWHVITGFRYKFGNSKALDLGYKALGVDYEDGTAGQPGFFQYDTITHGPAIGLSFGF